MKWTARVLGAGVVMEMHGLSRAEDLSGNPLMLWHRPEDACCTTEGECLKRKHITMTGFVLFLFSTALSACSGLDSIDYSPEITPEEFLVSQTYLHLRFPLADFILIH